MGRLFDSKQFRTDLQLSGSFSGSFTGDGSSLTNVPATGIVGLNLSQIGSGSATASISPDNGLHVNTSISASIISGSILVTAPTGSFSHIITDDDTIEFRNKSTGIQTGRLKFDSENGLNVQDSAGGRTRIKAGFGKFLQLESFSSFNSIGPLTASIISASSTIFANDIEAFRMNVTHLTSSFITASTIETSGSNIFGDESSDTHTFVGDIIAQNNISSSGYISASNFIGDGSQLSGVDSIYTANGNILETRTINDRDGGFTGTAGSNALKMNVRNSGALLVAGYQNNGDPGTTNHLIQWGPGTTAGGMNIRGKLGLTGGGGRIDLTNSGGSQYFTVAQTGITSIVPLSVTNITGSNISASGIFTGDGSGLINIPASGITGLNLSQIASGSATASISPDKGFQVNTDTQITGSLNINGHTSVTAVTSSNGGRFESAGSAGEFIIKNAGNDADAFTVYMTDGTGTANIGAYGGINFISRYGSIGTVASYNNVGTWGFNYNVNIAPGKHLSGSATSTASFGTYLGDGSQLSGIVTQTNFTQSLFVSPSGDNSTAAVGDMMKPFASILAATGSANPGDTIIVYPGTYIEDRNLYKDGVNYHFLDGAKVVANSPVEPMWGGGSGQSNGVGASSNFSSSISITGHGEFISTSSNAMASAIFYIRVPSGVIEFKKATKHGVNAGPYQCLSAFGQWSAEDSTGTLTIRGSFENSGSMSSYSSVAAFHDGNINTDIVVRQHGGTGDGVRLWSATGDINGTMDVYSEGYCLFTQARTSPLSYLKGRFETLTSNQGTYYALFFGSGYRGNLHIDAEVRGAIYIGPGDVYEGSVHVRGYQEVSNSPGGGACVIASGQNQLSQRIYGASSNAIFKITGGQTTFDGTVRPTGYNSKVFDISAGTFNWKGTCTGNASYPTTRTDPNVVSGGELIIESQFECFSQAANVNDEYMFNLSGGTLDIRNKLRNNVNQANNGIIDMTGGYLRMNGAELVHATQTGSFAYAIDLNGQTHSGSILNNCFTNLQPFNSGSFTNEIVGGGTLFESHKLY